MVRKFGYMAIRSLTFVDESQCCQSWWFLPDKSSDRDQQHIDYRDEQRRLPSSLLRIIDAAVRDDVCRLLLGHIWNTLSANVVAIVIFAPTWRILNLCNPLLTSALAKQYPGS